MTVDDYVVLADRVIERLEAWLAVPEDGRPEPVPEQLFRDALRAARAMRDEVREHRQLPKGQREHSMTREFAEGFDHPAWPRASGIALDVEKLERAYDIVDR